MPIDSKRISQALLQTAGPLLGFSQAEISDENVGLAEGDVFAVFAAAFLKIQHQQLLMLERIAISNEGQWDCCKNGSERGEALLDVTLNNPEATPQDRFAMYDNMLKGGGGAGSGQVG